MKWGAARLRAERAAHVAECAARRGPPVHGQRPDTDAALRANPALLERLPPTAASPLNRLKRIGFNDRRQA